MKIRTQSFILIAGIAAMPLLVLSAFFIVVRISFAAREAARFERTQAERLEGGSQSAAERIEQLIREHPKDFDIAIAGPDGTVLYSSIPAIPVGADFGPAVFEAARERHKDRMLSFGFMPPLPEGYQAIASVPRSNFLPSRVLEGFIAAGILALAAILAFAAVMSIAIVRSIARSVLALEEATRRVASGELDVPIEVAGDNEFASLARSLNSLREKIREDQAKQARFIMGISHDLKTPLALVKGYAEALEGELGETGASEAGSGASAGAYLGIIQAKADQLEGMIDDLIDFVRVDTGEWSDSLASIELGPFLLAFVKRIEADAELLGRSARGAIDLPEGLRVRMDERLVSRALENLVCNSLRYTPAGGRVEVAARSRDGRILVVVSDDGPGIAADDLPHVFEPFYRGSASRREQGMGLGLSIVKTVIESHGWSISAESEQGRGVAFTISMPADGVRSLPDTPKAPAAP
jgi:signal transduction histidine kinase